MGRHAGSFDFVARRLPRHAGRRDGLRLQPLGPGPLGPLASVRGPGEGRLHARIRSGRAGRSVVQGGAPDRAEFRGDGDCRGYRAASQSLLLLAPLPPSRRQPEYELHLAVLAQRPDRERWRPRGGGLYLFVRITLAGHTRRGDDRQPDQETSPEVRTTSFVSSWSELLV